MTLLLTSNQNTRAQNNMRSGMSYIGVAAGIGNSWVDNLPGTSTYKTAGYVGVGYIHMITNHWGLGGQAAIAFEGYRVEYLNSMQTFTPMYFRLPMRGYYVFGRPNDIIRPDVYLGPSVGMKLAEHNATTNNYNDLYMVSNSNNFRMFDIGVDGGAGIDIQLAKNALLNLDIGFYSGFTDAVKDLHETYNPQHDVDFNVSLIFGIR